MTFKIPNNQQFRERGRVIPDGIKDLNAENRGYVLSSLLNVIADIHLSQSPEEHHLMSNNLIEWLKSEISSLTTEELNKLFSSASQVYDPQQMVKKIDDRLLIEMIDSNHVSNEIIQKSINNIVTSFHYFPSHALDNALALSRLIEHLPNFIFQSKWLESNIKPRIEDLIRAIKNGDPSASGDSENTEQRLKAFQTIIENIDNGPPYKLK